MPESEDQKMYQFDKSLRRLESRVEANMEFQSKAFDHLGNTLEGIKEILSHFRGMSKQQTEQQVILQRVVEDVKEIKNFKNDSDCRTHDLEIQTLKESVASKAGNATLLFNGIFIASFASGLTAFFTWFFTKT